jgi:hypothetical protein
MGAGVAANRFNEVQSITCLEVELAFPHARQQSFDGRSYLVFGDDPQITQGPDRSKISHGGHVGRNKSLSKERTTSMGADQWRIAQPS